MKKKGDEEALTSKEKSSVIIDDVERFLAGGGEVEKVKNGATGLGYLKLTPSQRKTANVKIPGS